MKFIARVIVFLEFSPKTYSYIFQNCFQDETEDRLEELKDILHEMKKTIELLYRDREELEDKLSNHMHCHAERAVHQEVCHPFK